MFVEDPAIPNEDFSEWQGFGMAGCNRPVDSFVCLQLF